MAKQIKLAKLNMQKVINEGVDKALIGLGLIGVTAARLMSPVDTGLLSNSITWAMQKDKGEAGGVGVKPTNSQLVSTPVKPLQLHIGTNVSYAAYVEYGSKNVAAQPFMLPARVKVQKVIDEGYVNKKIFAEIERNG